MFHCDVLLMRPFDSGGRGGGGVEMWARGGGGGWVGRVAPVQT